MKSLFISICGIPNAGKSTLFNALAGVKISAVSNKVQTTRNNIRGILTEEDTQLVFIDTPGVFMPKKDLEKKIVSIAKKGIDQGALVCLVVDGTRRLDEITEGIIQKYKEKGDKIVIALNKVDQVNENRIIPLIKQLYDEDVVDELFVISAKTGRGLKDLKQYMLSKAQEDHWYYDADDITDRDNVFLCSEITREQLFHILQDELPYSVDVETDDISYGEATQNALLPNGLPNPDAKVVKIAEIHQSVLVERESQKKIIIGTKGERLKNIAKQATEEMEALLDCRVKLKLFVKDKKDWIYRWKGE